MYWNRFRDIECLPAQNDDFKLVVNYLDEQYRLGLGDALKEPQAGQGTEQSSGRARSPIRHIKKRPLEFYKNPSSGELPYLFEAEVDLSAIDERFGDKTLTNYEWTRVYVVRVREDKANDESNNFSDGYGWYVLDGESTVLHGLNAKFGGIKIDDLESVNEYLDFFCSFLCAGEGLFALIQHETDLRDLVNTGELFEADLNERRRYAVFGDVQKYIKQPWHEVEMALKKKLDELKERQPDFSSQGAIGERVDSVATDSRAEKTKILRGLVLYGKAVLKSSFELTESGMVTMRDDQEFLRDLPVRRHTTLRHKRSGLIRFTKSASRKLIPAAEFKEYVLKATGVASFYNVLIAENVKFDPADRVSGLECLDVHFLGAVTFDHCHVTAVFRFEDCKFLGGVRAPGTIFSSQVSFKKSEAFILPEMPNQKTLNDEEFKWADECEEDYPVALKLDHARIDGSFSLERFTAHGSVSCRHLTARSDASFCGLQVVPLVGKNDDQVKKEEGKPYKAARANCTVVLDLQRSSFAGSLNLGIWTDSVKGVRGARGFDDADTPKRRRVTVCGDCRFNTMSIGKSLIIEGLAVVRPKEEVVDLSSFGRGKDHKTLFMSGMTVRGNIQSWEYDSWDPTNNTISPPLVVAGSIDLKWSVIDGYVDLRMSQIERSMDCGGVSAAWLTLEPSRIEDVWQNDEARQKTDEVSWAQYSILDQSYLSSPVGNATVGWANSFLRRMSVIQEDLKLTNAIMPGGVTLTGTTIGGTVDVRLGAQLGQIKALPALGIHTTFEKDKAGQFCLTGRHVVMQRTSMGSLSIRNSTIAGPVSLWGTQLGGKNPPAQGDAPKPVIDIATSDLKGGLYLHARSNWEGQQAASELLSKGKLWCDSKDVSTDWIDHQGRQASRNNFTAGAKAYFWQTIPDVFKTTVNGDVHILAADIRADLDLTNTQVNGRIRLNDSHVRCDVRAVACLQELDTKFEAPDSEQKAALLTELQTKCFHFEFQSLRCDGDLMLAGLVTAGDVDGRNAVVRGHVEFVCDQSVIAQGLRNSTKQKVEEMGSASIKGNLDLCGCEIGLLRIDGQSFQTTANKIDLARVTVATLKILSLPQQINLQSIKVGHWEVQNENDLGLLNATEPYDSWAYKSLENSRAAEGKDEDADKVHRNKNWRELDEKFGYEKESLSFTAHPVLRSIASLCMVSAVGPLIIPWGSCAQAATLFLIGLMLFFVTSSNYCFGIGWS